MKMKIVSHVNVFFVSSIAIMMIFSSFLSSAWAGDTLIVAVAANFILPSQELVTMFQKKTGVAVEATYTSTGKLYGQIVKGAPYDLFLAADEKRPGLLYEKKLSDKPFIYAEGRLVLWTAKQELCGASDWKKVAAGDKVRKIAIANTLTAPYGTVAMQVLKEAGLWELCERKFVFPQTVAQAFQYASTEAADLGFCAYSSALSEDGRKGCFYTIPEAPPIMQAACVLANTGNRKAAEEFARFLLSPEARKVKERYGYR
ncbi:MAG: molybdate ABC transporter substrate-binding protein [Syntrophales bacterium]|jgi:molybdate transport system substrate-binding protein|nr:molybdate ABC transporter substrate-binding protein [Syntrophales bacterium]